ncbi:hemerythrin domain-containing protein [Dactylosporangium sp. CA-233914]|uniref:hemerythrin domain-containing protein n=1 Tax=Dactylosporangium sp. CA-233914 TaxID=3239934 RepID=UPI003D9182F5
MADPGNYLLMHAAIRHELARLARHTAELHAGRRHATAGSATALREHIDLVFQVIHHHHVGEDDLLWPMLAEAGVTELDELAAEHELLDPLMARISAALDAFVVDSGDRAARAELATTAGELDALMRHHLEIEEAVVVPALTDLVPDERHARMERDMRKGQKMPIGFILSWVREADPGRFADLLRHGGLPLRLISAVTSRRRYFDRVRAAYGVEAAAPVVVDLRAEVEVFIPAGPMEVYRRISDPIAMASHSPECYRCAWVDGGPEPLPGARFRGWNRFKGMTWDRLCEIVTARPGEEFAYRTIRTTTRPDSTLWRFRLRPVDGGTLLIQSYDLAASAPVMLFEKVSRRPAAMPHAMRQTLERLAADLTRDPAPVP